MDCNGNARRLNGCHALLVAIVTVLAGSLGCSENASPGKTADNADPPKDDAEALQQGELITQKMLAAYRAAETYTDHAAYVQHSVYRGEGVERDLPFFHMSIALERPNRLRLSFQEAVEGSAGRKGFDIASDGILIRCTSGELAGQVQESSAPPKLTTENLLPDPLLREVFTSRQLGDVFPQLAMLLHEEHQPPVFAHDEAPRLLDTNSLRGRECYRVASVSPKGRRVFWIDAETYALHRMELPIDADREALDAENQFSHLAVWIDFEDATFNAQVDDKSFELEVPQDARRVSRFVAPPPPAPPENLGQAVAEFAFTTLDGDAITRESLAGKTVLLDFWQADCAPCKAHTPDLDAIYRELKSNDKFAFYAVSLDGARIDPEVAEKTLRGWGGSMPVLLDPKQDAIKKLKVEGTPTLMLLDGQGRLQYLHLRQHRDPQGLAEIIRKVLGGADLAAEARAEHRQLTDDYQIELESVTIHERVLEVEVPRPEVGDRELPKEFAASERWTAKAEDVPRPGNSLSLPAKGENDALRILVLDGGQALVEFDENGAKLARHEIPGEPASAGGRPANGFLRTLVDPEGNRWIGASSVGGPKVHVFDPQWKHVLAFPKDRHPGIADVQLLPYSEQAEPRLAVGYWGGIGVQGVGLDGKRAWSQRAIDQVVQLVPVLSEASGELELWCTSDRGTILVLDLQGKPVREFTVGLHSMMHVSSSAIPGEEQPNDGKPVYCGLALEAVGRYRAVGFTAEGEVLWEYELPRGEYSRQVERIQPVTLPGGRGAWMIAAANGAILWLDHDGQLIDRFQYGQPLTGLSLTNDGDSGILLVSTPQDLTAWELSTSKP